jgi:hypothetical protein
MTEHTITQAMTKPTIEGAQTFPKRHTARGMVPSTWISRSVRVEYEEGTKTQITSGQLLDFCASGIVLGLLASRTLIMWERLVLIELVED